MLLNIIQWVLQYPVHILSWKQNSVTKKHRFSYPEKRFFKVFSEWICTNRQSGILIHVAQYNSVSSTISSTYFVLKTKFSHKKTQIFVWAEKRFFKVFSEWICTNRQSGILIHVAQYNSVSSTISSTYFVLKTKFSHKKHRFSYPEKRFFKVFSEWICTNRQSGILIHVAQYNSVSSTISSTYFVLKTKFSHKKTQIFVSWKKVF